jgi:hypothetical protein
VVAGPEVLVTAGWLVVKRADGVCRAHWFAEGARRSLCEGYARPRAKHGDSDGYCPRCVERGAQAPQSASEARTRWETAEHARLKRQWAAWWEEFARTFDLNAHVEEAARRVQAEERRARAEAWSRAFREIFGAPSEPWWAVLGVEPTATPAEIKRAFRTAVKTSHPDVGGDLRRFKSVMAARDRAAAEGRL